MYNQALQSDDYWERSRARSELNRHNYNKKYEADKAARAQRERQQEFEDKRNRSSVREDSRYRKKYETKGSHSSSYSW